MSSYNPAKAKIRSDFANYKQAKDLEGMLNATRRMAAINDGDAQQLYTEYVEVRSKILPRNNDS